MKWKERSPAERTVIYIKTTFQYEERCKNLTNNRTFSGVIPNLGLLSALNRYCMHDNTHKTPAKRVG
jgi:hypothetical protein